MIKTKRINNRRELVVDYTNVVISVPVNANAEVSVINSLGVATDSSPYTLALTTTPQNLVNLITAEDFETTEGDIFKVFITCTQEIYLGFGSGVQYTIPANSSNFDINELIVGETSAIEYLEDHTVQKVSSKSALKALAPTQDFVASIVTANQNTTYYYDIDSTLTANDYTVIAPNSGTGRWILLPEGEGLDIRHFGAEALPLDASLSEQARVSETNRIAIEKAFEYASYFNSGIVIPTVFRTGTSNIQSMTFFIDQPLVFEWKTTVTTEGSRMPHVVGRGNITPDHNVSWENKPVVHCKGGVTRWEVNILTDEDGVFAEALDYEPPYTAFLVTRGDALEDPQVKEFCANIIGGTSGPSYINVCAELINTRDCRIVNTLGNGTLALLANLPPQLVTGGFTCAEEESMTRIFFNQVNFFNYNITAEIGSIFIDRGNQEIGFTECYSYNPYGPHVCGVGNIGETVTNPGGWTPHSSVSTIKRLNINSLRVEFDPGASAPQKLTNRLALFQRTLLEGFNLHSPYCGDTSSGHLVEIRDTGAGDNFNLNFSQIQTGFTGNALFCLRSSVRESIFDILESGITVSRLDGSHGTIHSCTIISRKPNPITTASGALNYYNTLMTPMYAASSQGRGISTPGLALNQLSSTSTPTTISLNGPSSFLRINSGSAAANIDFISNQGLGAILIVENQSSNTMTIRHNTSSPPSNHFAINTNTGANVSLLAGKSAMFIQSGNFGPWRLLSFI